MVPEEVLRNSFKNIKEDISRIQAQLLEISAQQIEVFGMLQELRGKGLKDLVLKQKRTKK